MRGSDSALGVVQAETLVSQVALMLGSQFKCWEAHRPPRLSRGSTVKMTNASPERPNDGPETIADALTC